jgi:hypothetical protein
MRQAYASLPSLCGAAVRPGPVHCDAAAKARVTRLRVALVATGPNFGASFQGLKVASHHSILPFSLMLGFLKMEVINGRRD